MSFNPWEGDYFNNPYPILKQLQQSESVHWSEVFQGWIVTSYDLVKQCCVSPDLSSKKLDFLFNRLSDEMKFLMKPVIDNLKHWAIMVDGDEHREIRPLLNKAFSPNLSLMMEPFIQECSKELINYIDFTREFDLVEKLSYPLPALVIAKMFGVPSEKIDWFKGVSRDISNLFNLASKPDIHCAQQGLKAINELDKVLAEIIQQRRTVPQEDFISKIVCDKENRLDQQKLISTLTLLLIAGHETTTNLISNGVWLLANHPDQLDDLRRNPDLIESAVEEILRYESPVQNLARVALSDFDLGGMLIRKGDKVVPFLNAANRDPQAFEDPDTFDIRRKSNRHLSFGFGKHLCVGSHLARLEMKIVLQNLLGRLADSSVSADAEWAQIVAFRQMSSLKIVIKT